MCRTLKIPFKSNILTKNGYIKTEILTKKRKFLESDEIINFKLLNDKNKLINVKFISDITSKIYEINTITGNKIYISEGTKVKVLDSYGKYKTINIEDIKKEDVLISKFNDNVSSKKEIISLDNAYLLGYLYSLNFLDLVKTNDKYIEIRTENIEVFGFLKEIILNKFDVCIENDKLYIYNSDLSINNYILGNNFNNSKIPNIILESDIETQISFLKGFYDVNTNFLNNSIIKKVYNENLFEELLLVMKNIGIIVENKNKDFVIKGDNVIKFYNLIGFLNTDYENKLWNFSLSTNDFCVISEIQKIVKEYITTIKNADNLSNIELNTYNIKKLLTLDGDKILKNHILELINENIFYDRIDFINILDNELCLTIEVNENEFIILDSLII